MSVWPDVFPVVLYCRMWWRELCPVVVVLARMPLTRWLRRWNMLIKLKTSSKNLHQTVTLVVSGATVRFICCETCPCWRACLSVCLCLCVCVSDDIRVWWVLPESVSCGQYYDAGVFEWLFDKSCHFQNRICDSLCICFVIDINNMRINSLSLAWLWLRR